VNRAASLIEESVALDRKTNNLTHLSMSLDLLGVFLQIGGEWDQGEKCLQEAFSISQRLNDWQSISNSYGWLGWLYFEKGEFIKAKEHLEKEIEIVQKAGVRTAPYYYNLIRTYIELEEIEKAKTLIDKYCEYALEVKEKMPLADADALKGMLFRAQRRWKESIEHFEKSLQQWEAMGARQWYLYKFARINLYEYARVFLERNQEGDRAKAHNLLNQALEIFQKLGAKIYIEKILAKKKLLTA